MVFVYPTKRDLSRRRKRLVPFAPALLYAVRQIDTARLESGEALSLWFQTQAVSVLGMALDDSEQR